MCVCVCVCVHIFIDIYMCVYTYVCVYICVCERESERVGKPVGDAEPAVHAREHRERDGRVAEPRAQRLCQLDGQIQ